jgi:hypothetical protein
MTHRPLLAVLMLAALPALARAQFAPGSPNDPDTPIDAAGRAAVVESLATAMQRYYVFPERGTQVAKALRKRQAAHEYDRITGSKEFADSLLAHVQAVTHDLHTRVHYRYEPLPEHASEDSVPPEEQRRQHEQERLRNFGFEKVQRLRGNVGYLELRQFSSDDDAQQTAIAAMNFLGNVDALVIDLRKNGGGDPAMIQTLLTYLVAENRRLHFNDFYERDHDALRQWWTASYVPGQRLAGKPLYVLTSAFTGSAAEEFAYDVQTHKLGTLVGATTAGAANPGGLFRLNAHLAAFIATGRAINPVTKTNWEGVGVKPDVNVPPETALREAYVAAVQSLLDAAHDDDTRTALGNALEFAKKLPADPAEDYVRPVRRRAS